MGPCGDEEFLIDLSVRVREGGREFVAYWGAYAPKNYFMIKYNHHLFSLQSVLIYVADFLLIL